MEPRYRPNTPWTSLRLKGHSLMKRTLDGLDLGPGCWLYIRCEASSNNPFLVACRWADASKFHKPCACKIAKLSAKGSQSCRCQCSFSHVCALYCFFCQVCFVMLIRCGFDRDDHNHRRTPASLRPQLRVSQTRVVVDVSVNVAVVCRPTAGSLCDKIWYTP